MKAIIIAASLICIGLISGAVYFATRPVKAGPRTVPISAQYTARVSAGGWDMGATAPKVKIVEYADFQCPACDAAAPIIKEAMAQTSDIAQLEYRPYPLQQHDKAQLAAIGAEAAGRQGKFWEMHDKLFDNQSTWVNDSTFTFRDRLVGYAKDLGLDTNQFNADLDDSTTLDQINKSVDAGNAINLQATPTIQVNGTTLDNDTTTAIIQQGVPYLVNYIKTHQQ